MIWLKRLLPLLVILLGWFLYKGITKSQREKAMVIDSQYALITAKVWLASSTYRAEPARFIAYRDSLMQDNNISRDEMFRHLQIFENDLNRELKFSQMVSHKVDSLLREADSLKKYAPAVSDTTTLEPLQSARVKK